MHGWTSVSSLQKLLAGIGKDKIMNKPGTFIQLHYWSVDGVHKHENFSTLEEAQTWAQDWIGRYPEIGRGYAISGDGIGKITARGCSLQELFPGA